jgi:phage baseplate assembly protein W
MPFKPHPVTRDVVTKKDDSAIKQAVSNLLYTRIGERPFNSGIGTNLANLLFEPLNSISAGFISSEIREVLNAYEPRIKVVNVEVTPNFNSNGFDVILAFVIVGREDNLVSLDLFLERP